VLSNSHALCSKYASCTQNFSDLQFDPELLEFASLTLPTMTLFYCPAFPYLVDSSKFRGFTDSQVHKSFKAFFAPLHPRHLRPFPMHINYAFTNESSTQMFEKIGINQRKAQGHLPLKRINGRILWNLMKFFLSILNWQKIVIYFSFFKASS
jgi:hypothetical protein